MSNTHEYDAIYGGLLTTTKPDEHPFVIYCGERYYVRGDIELQDLIDLLIGNENNPGLQEEVDELQKELDEARGEVEDLGGDIEVYEETIEDRDKTIKDLRLKLLELGVKP